MLKIYVTMSTLTDTALFNQYSRIFQKNRTRTKVLIIYRVDPDP